MTSLCHGTLASASASALQGVAFALAWPWECSDGLGLGLGVCGLVNIPDNMCEKKQKVAAALFMRQLFYMLSTWQVRTNG